MGMLAVSSPRKSASLTLLVMPTKPVPPPMQS